MAVSTSPVRAVLLFLVSLSLLFVAGRAEASHALGAEITYECLGGNQYRIRLVFYRDCGGISAPTSPVVNISGCGNQNVTMTLQPATVYGPPFSGYLAPYELPVYCSASDCSNGNNPGIQEYIYEATVTLNPCANWTISYDLCCRSAAINTISAPGSQDIYVSAFLNNLDAPCNNSPQFDFPARGFLCINQPNQIVATATDPDGDLLVYSLYTPWDDPGNSVNYTGAYSPTNPLNNTQYTFTNGVIDVFPTTQQITVIGVMIEEYRNGVLIGRIVRDMQVRVVTNCPQNPSSTWDTNGDQIMDPVEYTICTGSQVLVDIYIDNTLPNHNYTLTMDNTAAFAGATFNTTPDPAMPGSVIGHFTWTPSAADMGQTFNLLFTAFDDNCPMVGYANFVYQMTLTGLNLVVDIDTVAISCTDSTLMTALADNGTAPYTYMWNTGVNNPSLWVTAGQYYVDVVDAMGCTGSDTINVYYIDDPVSVYQTQNGCVGSNFAFTDASYNNVPVGWNPIPIVDWSYDFGDGTLSTGVQNPVHQYTQSGLMTTQLVVTNQLGCTDTTWHTLWVNPAPVPDFSFSNECLDTLLTFTDLTTIDTGQVTGWTYTFGDGSAPVQAQNTTHQYAATGFYNVMLATVSDSGCTANVVHPVYVYPLPVADFSPTDACLNNASTFQDLSAVVPGDVEGWEWDFGDGTTATSSNPVHTYTSSGIFNVTMIAHSDSGCTDTITQQVTVHPSITAAFSQQPECAFIASQFTDNSVVSSGAVVAWDWNFGDGATDAVQNPTHAYGVGGLYNVTLIVTSDMGCTDSASVMALAYPKPDAAFTGYDACLGDANVFEDQSLVATGSSVVQWEWDFDGMGISNMQDPQFAFPTSGIHPVVLMVETDFGCRDTVTHDVEVYVLPTADFTFSDICLYDAAVFTNTSAVSQGSIVQNQWTFGNGNIYTGTSPTGQSYPAPGLYDVRLVVRTNNACRDTIIQQIEVFPVPVADFTWDTVCYPSATQFTDLSTISSYSIADHEWDFGDGSNHGSGPAPTHQYPGFGYYTVNLLTTSVNGCEHDTTLGLVVVHPKPVAAFGDALANCFGVTTTMTDSSELSNFPLDSIALWEWDLGDGTIVSAQDTAHQYAAYGIYQVRLAVESNNGCQDTVVHPVEIYPLPQVSLGADTTQGCQPFEAQFIDLSQIPSPYALSQWQWTFGDGTDTVTAQHPSHLYNDENLGDFDSGVYDVTLTVTSANGCVDSVRMAGYITEYPKPDALFTTSPDVIGILDPRVFITDHSTPNVTQWDWNFGDGTSSTLQHPVHAYNDTLSYLITEIVSTDHGCLDTASYRIRIEPNFTFWIPSSFTPNADGHNETFFGDGVGIAEYEMRIYDRWGEMIFESFQKDHPWDGTYRGAAVQQGVYVYVFHIIDVLGNPHRYRGDVTLQR
jgi:gliding motility-associated-like protein